MVGLEIQINHLKEDAEMKVDQEATLQEFDEIHAKTVEANAHRL